jgi:hypothetical protein
MDQKTIDYMTKRVDEANSLKNDIHTWRQRRFSAEKSDICLCRPNEYGQHYNIQCPFPDDARAAVIREIDARIAELQKKLDEL